MALREFGSPPFILRIAGLPSGDVEVFSNQRCTSLLSRLFETEDALRHACSRLVDRVYEEIPQVKKSLRPILLQIKRDAHNGRDLTRNLASAHGQEIQSLLGASLDQVLDLEGRLQSCRDDLAGTYSAQRLIELQAIERLASEPRFRRGVALASPSLAEAMQRWLQRSEGDWHHRKAEKLQQSVLRYASRAALKLSPYSTLTPVALGTILEDRSGPSFWLELDTWKEHSLVRLRRHLTDQVRDLLLERPLEHWKVALGSELQTVAPGRYRLLRHGHWKRGEGGGLSYQQDAIVHVRVSGPAYSWLEETLGAGALSITDLRRLFESKFPEVGAEFDAILARMTSIGFLRYLLPLKDDELNPEAALLALLEAVPDPMPPHIRELRDNFRRIVAVQKSFPGSLWPDRNVEEINRLVDRRLPEIFGVLDSEAPRSQKAQFNEDVFLTPGSSPKGWYLAGLCKSKAREIVQTLNSWVQVTNIFHHRYDFLLALAQQMRTTWPESGGVPLLDLLSGTGGLWREFSAFVATTRQSSGIATFDPFHDKAARALQELRLRIWSGLQNCSIAAGDNVSSVDCDALESLLSLVPPDFRSPVGGGFFLQPADPMAESWVINQLGEGSGRFSSRFTTAMPSDLGTAFANFLAKTYSLIHHLGEEIEIVGVVCPNGDNLNIHLAQTSRVLVLRSEEPGKGDPKHLRLRDLQVELPAGCKLPRLRDFSGRQVMPVHLGLTNLRLMPVLVKVVAQFGPSEFHLLVPSLAAKRSDGVTVQDRLVLGNVVLRRKRWLFLTKDLMAHLDGAKGYEAFVRMNRWRMGNGIPDKIFIREQRPFEFLKQEIFKPQFIDFSSPLFTEVVLEGLTHRSTESMVVEEALPMPESGVPDGKGKLWAVELLIDSRILQDDSESS